MNISSFLFSVCCLSAGFQFLRIVDLRLSKFALASILLHHNRQRIWIFLCGVLVTGQTNLSSRENNTAQFFTTCSTKFESILCVVRNYTLLAKKTTVRFHSEMFFKPDVISLSQGLFSLRVVDFNRKDACKTQKNAHLIRLNSLVNGFRVN